MNVAPVMDRIDPLPPTFSDWSPLVARLVGSPKVTVPEPGCTVKLPLDGEPLPRMMRFGVASGA